MIDEALRAFLERGCAMIVGTVAEDGTPHAQRAWGCSVVAPESIRVLLDDRDPVLRDHLDARGRIAVTAADVRTLRSAQLKGRVTLVDEHPTEEDVRRCEQHNAEVLTDIEETDHFPRELSGRMIPLSYLVAEIAVDEVYDQTPGPRAGHEVAGAWPT